MKKLSTFLCMVLCSIALHANVVSGTCGDNLTWSYDTDTKALTIEGTGDMSYNEVPWTQVKSDILSVSLPDGLTSIGGSAFQGCTNLTSITVPNSVTSMGDGVFYDCFSLTSVTLGNSVTSIGQCTFRHCSALTSIIIPNSVTSIGWVAFEGCSSLTSVIIGNSVTNIDSHAFWYCTALTSVTLGNSVSSIGECAFGYCPLISVTIPNSVTNIGKDAFHDCSQVIVECTTPPTIESGTFKSDASICVPCSASDAYLQTAVWHFLDLKGLNHTIDLSATEGGKAHITATDCNANTATIEATSSDNCLHFVQWSDGIADNPRIVNLTQDTTLVAQFESRTYQVNIYAGENGLLKVGSDSYYWDTDTFSIEMTDCGNELTTNRICAVPDEGYYFIGWSDGYTEQCRSIRVVSDTTLVAKFSSKKPQNFVTGTCGDNLTWSYDPYTKALTIEGTGDMYDYDYNYWSGGSTQPWAQVRSGILSLSLPDGLTSIGSNAFHGCSSLTSVTIPNSVTSIGGNAFNECSSLTSVTLSNLITNIGRDLFCDCSSLTSITIPNSVTNIGEGSFARCYALTTIIIPNSVKTIERNAFVDCYHLTSVFMGDSVTSIGESSFCSCSALTSITIPDGVTSIGGSAFARCSALKSITIPNSVTSIGGSAFNSCSQVIVECTTPPTIESSTFKSDVIISVPCFTRGVYLTTPIWQFLPLVDDGTYRINLTATKGCKANITATDCDANTATIEAVANELYQFSQWSDGNTENPRTLTLTQDITLQAEFSTNYYIAGNDENLFGSVWVPNSCMLEKQADGTYAKSFTNCIPAHEYQFKITLGSWEYNWGCNSVVEPSFIACESNENVVVIPATTNLKVIFDPATELITVEGELYQALPKYNVTLRGIDLYGYYQYTDSWGDIYNEWFDDRTEISFTIKSGLSVRVTEEGYCGTWLGWSDGNTEKDSRTITITSDTVITSLFDVPTYQVNISAAANGLLTLYGEPIDGIETTMTDCNSNGEWLNEICAVPDEGYYFTGWSDGYTEQCRSIKVVSDTTLVANFAEKQQVQVLVGVESACKNMGTVSSGGIFYQGDVVTITATPNSGYHFVEWSDGNSNANREIYLTSDTTLFATFAAGDMGGKCGNDLYWTWEDGALTITGTGDMDLDTHPAWWQYENLQITSVSMPEGMTSISSWAFYEQPITTVLVPASVEEIGDRAFADNDQLTHFEYLGNNIHRGTELEEQYRRYSPLADCSNLQYFRGNKDLLDWEDYYGSLDTVIISNGQALDYLYYAVYVDNTNASNVIMEGNYDYVNAVRTLYLPAGLVEIGDYALQNARFLGGITIPEGVTRIGISAFEDCRSMDSVVFAGNNVQEIGAWAFYNCHSLRNLTLPEGVEEIGRAAFFDCVYLTELTIPSTMKKIADNGFAACRKLSTMYVNALVPPTIEAKTFEDVDRATPVFVPRGTMELYQADQYWSEFFNMTEYDAPTGNLTPAANETNGLRKVVRDGQVLILRGDKTYTILGETIQ